MRKKILDLVWTNDDAIDFEAMTVDDVLQYINDRDITKLQIKQGQRPTVFRSTWIVNDVFDRLVMSQTDPYPRARMCFRLGVTEVVDPNGTVWRPSGTTKGRLGPHQLMTDEECDRYSPAEVEEIGTALYYHSFLPLRTDGILRAPPSSLDILTQRTFRSAEESQNGAVPTNDEPSASTTASQAETPNESAKDASPSDSPTDAIAGAAV